MTPSGDERGFVLVVTMVVTALAVALLVSLIDDVNVSRSGHAGWLAAEQGSIIASTACEAAARILSIDLSSRTYSSEGDIWGTPKELESDEGSVVVTVSEESGKINLNNLVLPNGTMSEIWQPVILRLFRSRDIPADRVEAVADWIDPDDTPRTGGGETVFYGTMTPPRKPSNAPLETVEELLAVAGIDPARFERLRPVVTVYADAPASPSTPVNINTAPKDVLMALDDRITVDLADRIVQQRRSSPFRSVAELASIPGMETIAIALAGKTTVKGSVFRITARATVRGVTRVVERVVRVGSNVTTLYVREY